MILAVLALAAGIPGTPPIPVRSEPVEARDPSATPASSASTSSVRTMEGVDQVARQYALAGEILVAKGDVVLLDKGYGPVAPAGKVPHRAGQRWRLASITKQVTAALVLRALADTGGGLDRPLTLLPGDPASPTNRLTARQLLTHHTGLANPDDTPATAGGMPGFYGGVVPNLPYCLSKPATPGAPFAYNNCDYVLAGTLLNHKVDGRAAGYAWPRGMRMANGRELVVPGFVAAKPEPAFNLASFGSAGGLTGTARDVLGFDRQLMTGKLLTTTQRDELWKPEGGRSYQALGQWVFPGQLKGCARPKRIVQRDGEIGGVQTRNFIFPDDDLVVIVFTNRSADDFTIGEVWQGKGFAYDLLSAVACA